MKKRKSSKTLVYIVSIGIALAVGAVSALFSMKGMESFEALHQPPLSPPGWLFPVVWTALYVLMGISAARVYIENTADTAPALRLYIFQLFVNALWSPVFFTLELRLVAFVLLLILIAVVIAMIAKFKRVDAAAGNLQFPYLAWLLFAGYLNLGVYLLNG